MSQDVGRLVKSWFLHTSFQVFAKAEVCCLGQSSIQECTAHQGTVKQNSKKSVCSCAWGSPAWVRQLPLRR